jgi:hypothetical protein
LVHQWLRWLEWLRQWLSLLSRTGWQCCSGLLYAGSAFHCGALDSLLRGFCATKLRREQAQVLLCDGNLPVSSKDLGVLFVQLVQRRKLPVLNSLELTVLKVGDLPEDSDLFHKVLQTFRVHGEVVLIDGLRETGLLLFLQLLHPVVDNFLKLGSCEITE